MWQSPFFLAALVESSDDAIISKSPDGVIMSWNHGAELIFGYRADEIIGHSVSALTPEDLREEEADIRARIRRGLRVANYETRRVRKDGTMVEVSLTLSPIVDNSGSIVAISKIARDITPRKRLQEELFDKKQSLELLSDTAVQLLSAHNPVEALQWMFPRLAQQTQADLFLHHQMLERSDALELSCYAGVSEAEASLVSHLRVGERLFGRVAADRRPMVVPNLQARDDSLLDYLKTAGVKSFACNPLLADDHLIGTLAFGSRSQEFFTTQQLELFGTLSRYLALALDRWRLLQSTSQRAAELERRVAERTASLQESLGSLEGVLYHVAHDLRAPLRAMHSFTQLLLEDYAPRLDTAGEQYAQIISEASKRMDMLIRDLLSYGRLGHQKVAWTPVDLNTIVDPLIESIMQEVGPNGAEFRVDRPLPKVQGDPHLISQIFDNLLSNAIKFVEPGCKPKVRIFTETRPGRVCVLIKDNGIGIPEGYQERIFLVFERLHNTQTYPGTGIGLAIVRKGMERLRGHVGVTSTPGEGSCFWLEFKPPVTTP